MGQNILEALNGKIPDLSKNHKKIARYIIENIDEAAFLTAAEIGKKLDISESTVVRFATALGYAGFPAFQRELSFYLRNRLKEVNKIDIKSEISHSAIIDYVMQSDCEKIKSSLEDVNSEVFDTAVSLIKNAGCVYVVGIRTAAPLADIFEFYLRMVVDRVVKVTTNSSSEIFEQMVRIGKDDVIIGISFPRYSMRTLKAMEFANNRNAKVITLTDSVHSPMNLYSSCNLIADSDMASIVDSLVAPLSVINALIVALCMKNRKKVAKTLEMLEDIWDEYQVYESDEINYIDDSIKMRYGKIGDTEFNE